MFLLDIEPAIHAAIPTISWSLPEVRRSCLFIVKENLRWEALEYYGDRVLFGVITELLRQRYSHLPTIFSVTARRIIVCNETLGYMMDSMGYRLPGIIATSKARGDLFEAFVGLYRTENSREKTMEWARATFIPILDCAARAYWPPFVPLTEPPPLPRLPPVPRPLPLPPQTFPSLPLTSTPPLSPPPPSPPPPPTQTPPSLPKSHLLPSSPTPTQLRLIPQPQQLAATSVGVSRQSVENPSVSAMVGDSRTPAPANTLNISACSESEQEAQQTDAYRESSTKRKREQTRSPESVGKRRRRFDLSDTSLVAANSKPATTSDNSAPASVSLPAALGASRTINSAVSQKSSSSSYTVPGASRRTPRGPRFWREQRARRHHNERHLTPFQTTPSPPYATIIS